MSENFVVYDVTIMRNYSKINDFLHRFNKITVSEMLREVIREMDSCQEKASRILKSHQVTKKEDELLATYYLDLDNTQYNLNNYTRNYSYMNYQKYNQEYKFAKATPLEQERLDFVLDKLNDIVI